MPSSPLLATTPSRNATVHASAGTGKTWLLVTRMVRLLLAGASPGNILAITFTRKAAAEMQQRLNERLANFAMADDATLDSLLEQIDITPTPALRRQARGLYEQLMFSEQRPRTTTFHAFCQEILQRFPLEAEVPPGFELLEAEGHYREAAWASLYADATQAPDSDISQALEQLFELCNGMSNTHRALDQFLAQRIDWWAFTRDKDYPARWATAVLRQQLEIDPEQDPTAGFFSDALLGMIEEFAGLLAKHDTATNLKHSAAALSALDDATSRDERIAALQSALFTQAGKRQARKSSKTLINKLGDAGAERLLQLHDELCTALEALQEQQNRRTTYQLNRSWYLAGQALLQHYQRIKQEQRLLDFADLEWRAYTLLNQAEQAHWVQYKLDARIDHLLVDEFQDTNPTQWRLLLPLLEELAAGTAQRERSVFLVGDAKQSIYRFRRADARLLDFASGWLEQQLQAQHFSLDRSRRSSRAVIDCVNAVFRDTTEHCLIDDFPEHSTFHEKLWGEVRLLPLIEGADEPEPVEPAGLRNPLQQPRLLHEDPRFYREGQQIANMIQSLIDEHTVIGSSSEARVIEYRDCMILLRNRTHSHEYERALRDAGIPFLGAARGALLHSQEAQDLEALLNTLIAPHNNLALAQVLRCPLFACSDDDLVLLAQTPGSDWMTRLLNVSKDLPEQHPLALAATHLTHWREWAGILPVHDLLDRIYFEGDLLRRYLAATPDALQPRVQANLLRFLELALEIDSGRYPSLTRFVNALYNLREQGDDAPDDASPSGGRNRVQFLTVHGAKGLEAPVVFLADAASTARDRSAWSAMVDWPAERSRPQSFFLLADTQRRDQLSTERKQQQDAAAAREDANLLYVALTRARQCLYITGTRPNRGNQLGWYGILQDALPEGELTSGQPASPTAATPCPASSDTPADPRLLAPIRMPRQQQRIAPSRQVDYIDADQADDPDACERGVAIHRLLELLSEPQAWPREQVLTLVARETRRAPDEAELLGWVAEAEQVLADTTLADIFPPPDPALKIYKEAPLSYPQDNLMVDGVIDRLLVRDNEVTLVDFKSSQVSDRQQAETQAMAYQQQMALYAAGVHRLWPDASLQAFILFTHGPYLVEIFV